MIATRIHGCTRNLIRTDAFPSGDTFLNKCPLFSNRTRIIKWFSSSSSPVKKGPGLSGRNKRDLLILAVGLCGAFGYHLIHRDSDWEKDVWIVQNKLIASTSANQKKDTDNNSVGAIANNLPEGNSFSNHPPPVVLGYIEKVLQQPVTVSSLRPSSSLIVTAHQSGEFFAAKQWYPFEATLMAAASATNPGFVWDARTTIMNLSNSVLEYYITHSNNDGDNGNGGLDESGKTKSESDIVTKIWGKYPLIQIEEEDPYILFWLAVTPLFPAVFLPHYHQHGRAGILKWKDTNNTLFTTSTNSSANTRKNGQICASAQLRSNVDGTDTLFLVEFFFGEEDNLLHKIKVTSPSGSDEPWQAIYKNYKQHMVVEDCQEGTEIEGQKARPILVPSYIEIGKGDGEEYRSHFKIINKRLSVKR